MFLQNYKLFQMIVLFRQVMFKPSNENATYHRITFEDTDQFNQVKSLIANASGRCCYNICYHFK